MTDLDELRRLSITLLYEGCMLYPYRASALKNRRPGWTFGALLPPAYVAANPGESDLMQSQVLARIPADGSLQVEVRFLQLDSSAESTRVIERAVEVTSDLNGLILKPALSEFAFHQTGSQTREVKGAVEVSADAVAECAYRVTIRVRNLTNISASGMGSRDAALVYSLLSVNALITVSSGELVSLLDPPDEFRELVGQCRQIGVYPVLAGDPESRSTILISPIILYDFPQVAPESKGDFFDSSEIDEMLALRVLTLSDEERAEILRIGRAGSEIVGRTAAMSPSEMREMHGTFRSPSTTESNR